MEILLKWILNNKYWGAWAGLIWLRTMKEVSCYEYRNEHLIL
jgi:hypothetical protein